MIKWDVLNRKTVIFSVFLMILATKWRVLYNKIKEIFFQFHY